jgi:hypothetical protein
MIEDESMYWYFLSFEIYVPDYVYRLCIIIEDESMYWYFLSFEIYVPEESSDNFPDIFLAKQLPPYLYSGWIRSYDP